MHLATSFLNTVRTKPERIAAIDGDVRLNYAQFGERIARLAASLHARGVSKGDRVALLMLNDFRYLEIFYASFLLGAVVVPLNVRLAAPELSFMLQDSGSEVLFYHHEFEPLVHAIQNDPLAIRHYVLAEGVPFKQIDATPYEELVQQAGVRPATDWHEEDLAAIYYTGGTTGLPKGVMLTHKNLVANAFQVGLSLGYGPDDIYLHAAPMFHVADGASTFGITLVGGTHAHVRTFDPSRTLEVIARDKVTSTLLVPTMINALVNTEGIEQYDLSSWRRCAYGASPISADVLKKAIAATGCEFFQAYGMTEASPVLTILRPEDHVTEGDERLTRRLKSCGQPIFQVELKVVDPTGAEMPFGTVGEVIARGPNIMKGYWNRPEETAQALRDGWYWSGDLGAMDGDHFVYIVDRKKDMIITGGENVYSVEVENVIYRHPAVFEAAVVGVPDEKWGEAVKAVVVCKPGQHATEEELLAHCREFLAGYKVPKSVEFVDALPKSGAGKILKRSLRDQFWEGQARKV
ncbi:MAG: long-chain-fatty-acid--CoA ligase [Tumebacillaceae bacterium]